MIFDQGAGIDRNSFGGNPERLSLWLNCVSFNRMLRRGLARLNGVMDEVAVRVAALAAPSQFPPGAAPAMAAVHESGAASTRPSLGNYSLQDLVDDMRTLWGVPKYRTSKPKKQTRKFAYTRLMTPFENIETCESCGDKHETGTICGTCYEKVREVTNEIKRRMMEYNPYKGENPSKHVEVRFFGEEHSDADAGVKDGVRIVELERERPSWFKRDIKGGDVPPRSDQVR